MRRQILAGSVLAVMACVPFVAQAQIVQDTQAGAAQGNAAAGPLGGIVGGATGAATGAVGTATGIAGSALGGVGNAVGGVVNGATGVVGGVVNGATGIAGGAVNGVTGLAGGAVNGATGLVGGIFGGNQDRFNSYVLGQHLPSYAYKHDLRVGMVLPRTGPQYYDVPADYPNAERYRFARINDRTVIVDAHTRRIVQVM